MTALPNRDRRTERREATRREILDTAWEIARRDGVAALTLREVADRIGMRPPSLYSHFDSKNAVYDAMFAESWLALRHVIDRLPVPSAPREALFAVAECFVEFATADLARYQLMNERTMPDFEPSHDAYAASLTAYEQMRRTLRERGVRKQADIDLWTALLSGVVNQQHANEPGGRRWRRQLSRVVDMFCDEVGIPGPRLRGNR